MSEDERTEHLAESHDFDELSRLDRKRVEQHRHERLIETTTSRFQGYVTRRAMIATIGVGAVAGIVGLTGQASASFAGGDGDAGDPFQIETWDHLNNIPDGTDDHFILNTDLDEDTEGYEGIGDDWDPIDDFIGEFDGNGKTISDLVIDRPAESRVGLFGFLGGDSESVTVKNIALTNVDIQGDSRVGGLAGEVESGGGIGVIEQVAVEGTIAGEGRVGGVVGESFEYGGEITESYVLGEVLGVGSGNGIGGVVGASGRFFSGHSIERCFVAANVSAPDSSQVGGLVGRTSFDGSIEDCYVIGNVTGDTTVGGVVGDTSSNGTSFENVYAAGEVNGDDAGGLYGSTGGSDTYTANYWDEDTTSQNAAVGDGSTPSGTEGLGTDEVQGETPLPTADGGDNTMDGFDFTDEWHAVIQGEAINPTPTDDGYPILQAIDIETQLRAQEIFRRDASIVVEGDDLTVSNSTVRTGDDEDE